ncbi:MAG TPA: MFS transporter [Candidatus Bathyarchaeia archaeon]|nr:MFS transporter [Candidatus Bathyarchaeia archaeon]
MARKGRSPLLVTREALAPDARSYRWPMLFGVWLVYFCFGLMTASLAPLVGPIRAELGLSHAAMGGVLGAWPLVYIASAAPCGMVLDRIGLRWSLFAATLLIAVSGFLRALAHDRLGLYLAVAIFGVGGPLVSAGAPKLIGLWFSDEERGLAMGIYVTGPALGNVTALSLTNSVLMPLLDGRWRAVLTAWALVVLAAGAVWLMVSAHPASRSLERGARAAPRESSLAVFGELLRARSTRIVLLMSAGIFFFNHSLNNWLPEILRAGGMDARAAGFWSAVPSVIGIGAALVVPRLAAPGRRGLVLALLFAGAGAATLLVRTSVGPLLVSALVLQGVARGSMSAVAMLVLMGQRGDARHLGAAGGLFFSAAEIGGVLGPVSVGVLHDWSGGFDAALNLLTAVCAALLGLLAALPRATRSHSHHHPPPLR